MSHRSTCRANTAGVWWSGGWSLFPGQQSWSRNLMQSGWRGWEGRGGGVCVLTWHCWRNSMTPSLTSLNPVKLNINASGKLQQPPTRGALTRESVMEIENRERPGKYVRMTLTALVLNLVFLLLKYFFFPPPPSSASTGPVRWRGHPQKILFHYPWCFAVRTEGGHSSNRDVPGIAQSWNHKA